MLPFLVHGAPWPAVDAETEPEFEVLTPAEWWRFEQGRLVHHDPTHPSATWVAHLLQEAAATPLPCPCCGAVHETWRTLDHLLRIHGAGYAEAAQWLEEADSDLFSLAVHYLASKARAGCSPHQALRRVGTERCRQSRA